jgi:hypothetical protein
LGWNINREKFSCWQCGPIPNFEIFRDLFHLSPSEIKQLQLTKVEEVDYVQSTGKLQLPEGLGPLKSMHREYLHDRGFSERDIRVLVKLWQIQGIDHKGGTLSWRIFIPIYYEKELVSWTTRSIGLINPKRYITARADQEKINLKQILYGEFYCNHTCIVCEGPFDVMRIGPGAVCLFGLTYTRAQLFAIAKFPKRYICLDSDPAAQKIAKKLCSELMLFPGTTKNICLEAHDPGSVKEKELLELQTLLD